MIFEPALYIYQSPVGSDYIRDLYEITTELGSQRRDKKIEKSFSGRFDLIQLNELWKTVHPSD